VAYANDGGFARARGGTHRSHRGRPPWPPQLESCVRSGRRWRRLRVRSRADKFDVSNPAPTNIVSWEWRSATNGGGHHVAIAHGLLAHRNPSVPSRHVGMLPPRSVGSKDQIGAAQVVPRKAFWDLATR